MQNLPVLASTLALLTVPLGTASWLGAPTDAGAFLDALPADSDEPFASVSSVLGTDGRLATGTDSIFSMPVGGWGDTWGEGGVFPGDGPWLAEAADATSLGRAIVGYDPAAFPWPVEAGGTLAGLPVTKVVKQAPFFVVQAATLTEVRDALAGVPGVRYIEDDVVKVALAVPNDARYGEQYGPAQLGAHAAWDDAGFGSSDVTVAVLDTGIRRTHQDFQASRVLPGFDYVNNDGDPSDDCTHGTHVSGTVGATTNNAIGVAGVSQATILPMKVLGPILGLFSVTCTGSASDIAEAIYDATDQGADVISMSLGGGGSSTEENAVDYAWGRGVLVVAAAGNDGASNSVDCPACYSSVIAVAALTSSKARASYSDMGAQVEIAAAGSNVLSTSDTSDSAYTSLSGTSMATPHVAGALALVKGCVEGATGPQVRSAMQQTAEDLGAGGRDTSYGFGLIRADLMIDALGGCGGTPPPDNDPPAASFTHAADGLTVTFDGTASSDPDGSIASYAWTFGDGATGTGATTSHTYAGGGTYTVVLTVTDDDGATGQASQQVTVEGPPPPPGGCTDNGDGVPELGSGQTQSVAVASGQFKHFKVCAADGDDLTAQMTGPSCGLLSCSVDADLYTRQGAPPTTGTYDCRPYTTGNNESCSHQAVPQGWFYVSVHGYSGSGTVQLTATLA